MVVMSRAAESVIELEKQFWTRANDPVFFERSMADDGLAVFEPMGFVEKQQAMEMAEKGKPFVNVEMRDVQIQELTDDCVVLSYHGQGRRDGDQEPYRGTMCSVYVKRDDRWQLATTVHQPWNPDPAQRNGKAS